MFPNKGPGIGAYLWNKEGFGLRFKVMTCSGLWNRGSEPCALSSAPEGFSEWE